MYFAIGEWLTTALAVSNAMPDPHHAAHTHSITTDLRQIASAPVSAGAQRATPRHADAVANGASFDWSQPPATRARVFAERLKDVRPVCVVGSGNDRENCLLDLTPGLNVNVSASRLMLAGCEASLPATVSAALSRDGRDASALERAFSATFAAESQGKFSVAAIERRITQRLREMSPGMHHLLRRADVYLEMPRVTFLRVLTSQQEARRHHVTAAFTDPPIRHVTGAPDVHDAMLGAYIRLPIGGAVHTFLVSLATPNTIEVIRQDPRTHADQHLPALFGDVPGYFQATRLQMRTVGPGDDIVRTLAEWLHDGHQRYRDFARGETRESLAPESHRHVVQQACPSATPPRTTTAAQTPPQTQALVQAEAPPPTDTAPTLARSPRAGQPSIAEIEEAIAMLERLDKRYRSLGRPRFG
ncbi:hypothetical protein PCE31106_02188 [Pandoraea cepalis]|uniref:Uncharacterized protein n=1 Tax=Pandoraea cepalis TaxID=2508294 RepID=A0A5E4US33_9BURK|nr:hypothetical protein [Pandoraea cepalis]VVE02374.1 hypothetical protein PCE31106_02188 [Pandoraea cepalis]